MPLIGFRNTARVEIPGEPKHTYIENEDGYCQTCGLLQSSDIHIQENWLRWPIKMEIRPGMEGLITKVEPKQKTCDCCCHVDPKDHRGERCCDRINETDPSLNTWEISKRCSLCKELKPVSEFFKDMRNPDGFYSHCKPCYRITDAKRYYKNREKKAAYSRERFKNPEVRARKYADTKRQIEKEPHKNKARTALRNAITAGKIKRLPCQVCLEVKSHAHHPDYSKPLDVVWLCQAHHSRVHAKYNPLVLAIVNKGVEEK